jgi:predicted signal transduction protein with EAL and GGDEF domain
VTVGQSQRLVVVDADDVDAPAGKDAQIRVVIVDDDTVRAALALLLEHHGGFHVVAEAAIVTFARETGVAGIAEGIETTSQLVELRALGATSAQGFLFGRPLCRALDDLSLQGRRAG